MKINNNTNYQNNMSNSFQGIGINKAVKKRLLPLAITAAAVIGAKTCEMDMFIKQDKQPVKTEQTTPFNAAELILSMCPLCIIANPNEKDMMGRTELMREAEYGDINKLKKLLEIEEINPNIKDLWGYTALIMAAEYDRIEFVKALLTNEKTDPNIQDDNGWTALISAAYRGNTESIKALLANEKTDPNIQDNNGWTALIKAARRGNTESIKALLANEKTDPNIQTKYGDTALMWAVDEGSLESVKALLANKKTDPNIQNNKGWTPLDLAIINKKNEKIIETICLSENFDLNVSLKKLPSNSSRIFAENLIAKIKQEQKEKQKQRETNAKQALLETYSIAKFKNLNFQSKDYYTVTPYLRALENDILSKAQEQWFNEKQDNGEDSLLCKFVSSVKLCENNKKEYQEILDKLDKLDINYDQTDKNDISVFEHIMNSENPLLLKHIIKKGTKFTYNPNLDLAYKDIEDKEFKALLDEHKYDLVEFKDVEDALKSQDTDAIQSVQAQMQSPFFDINKFM